MLPNAYNKINRKEFKMRFKIDINRERRRQEMGGSILKTKSYSKPNMANLHGRIGEQILRSLRQQTVKSDDNIRKVAEDCKARLLANRKSVQ